MPSGLPTGTAQRRAAAKDAAPRKANGRHPASPTCRHLGKIEPRGTNGSRSSAGPSNCMSASPPDSGRRHSQSLSGEGKATHSRPRAKHQIAQAQNAPWLSPPAMRQDRAGAASPGSGGTSTISNPFARIAERSSSRNGPITPATRWDRHTSGRTISLTVKGSTSGAGRPQRFSASAHGSPSCLSIASLFDRAARQPQQERSCLDICAVDEFVIRLIVIGEQTTVAAFDAFRSLLVA